MVLDRPKLLLNRFLTTGRKLPKTARQRTKSSRK
ncbi:MAG: hypothetical protein ACI8O8_002135, partial [Oleiphilaceae bacterium]